MSTWRKVWAAAEQRDLIGLGRYVFRCAVAAMLAYFLAVHIRLPNPVWAPVSALVVSQERLAATRSSVISRFSGTVFGALVALAVHEVGTEFSLSMVAEVGFAVAVCAVFAKAKPSLRVCLWTAPLVLLSAAPGVPDSVAAACRATEVVLGAAVAGALHLIEDSAVARVWLWLRIARAMVWRARRA